MFNHLESLGTQESPVKVDLLHLDPTDPDGKPSLRYGL